MGPVYKHTPDMDGAPPVLLALQCMADSGKVVQVAEQDDKGTACMFTPQGLLAFANATLLAEAPACIAASGTRRSWPVDTVRIDPAIGGVGLDKVTMEKVCRIPARLTLKVPENSPKLVLLKL